MKNVLKMIWWIIWWNNNMLTRKRLERAMRKVDLGQFSKRNPFLNSPQPMNNKFLHVCGDTGNVYLLRECIEDFKYSCSVYSIDVLSDMFAI